MHAPGGNSQSRQVEPVPWHELRAYFTVVVLEFTGVNTQFACQQIVRALRSERGRRRAVSTQVVAESITTDPTPGSAPKEHRFDESYGFVHRTSRRPSWTLENSTYLDVQHSLMIVLRRGRMVIVHTSGNLRDKLQTWLDTAPRPSFRRTPGKILEECLLQGEAKGLWLRGTHRRRTTKPDAKNISGRRVQDTINPLVDASYALASGRAALPVERAGTALTGTIGTTTGSSVVWLSRTNDWHHFLAISADLLDLLEPALAAPSSGQSIYSTLAREVNDLSEVRGAFDLAVTAPEDLPSFPEIGDDLREAATLLQDAFLQVHGDPRNARFEIEVGFQGSVTGRLGAQLKESRGGFALDLGFRGEPSFGPPTRQILDALNHTSLISVYYRSGHTWIDGRVWKQNIEIARFSNWIFADFNNHKIAQEKPCDIPQELHDKIGDQSDTSLFGWVVRHFSEGSLTCDDGPDEIADFLHIHPSGVLSMIHVKAAGSASPRRRVSAAVYEVVTSQATKNLIYAEPGRLRARLRQPPVARPAAWENGRRCPNRDEFLDSLELRDATAPVQIVIVQPHLSEPHYRRLRDNPPRTDPSDDFLRLCRLETLLNAARTVAVSHLSDLTVIAANA